MGTQDVESVEIQSTTSSEFESGFEAGRISRDLEVEGLMAVADYWYFRANNPRSEWPEVKMVNSIIDGMEVRAERERVREELDRVEQELFSEARELIAQGKSDVEVATTVGLFLPIVENLRAGVL